MFYVGMNQCLLPAPRNSPILKTHVVLVKIVDIQCSPPTIYENCLDEKYAWRLADSVQNLELHPNIELSKRKVDNTSKSPGLKAHFHVIDITPYAYCHRSDIRIAL